MFQYYLHILFLYFLVALNYSLYIDFFKRKIKAMAENKENAVTLPRSTHSLGNLRIHDNGNDDNDDGVYPTDEYSDVTSLTGFKNPQNDYSPIASPIHSPNRSPMRGPKRPYSTPGRGRPPSGMSQSEQLSFIDDGTNPLSQSQFSHSQFSQSHNGGMSEYSSVNGGTFNGTFNEGSTYNDGTFNGTFNDGSTYNDGTFNGTFNEGSTYNDGTLNGTFNEGSTYNDGTFNGTFNEGSTYNDGTLMSMGSYGTPAMGGFNNDAQYWAEMDDYTLSQHGQPPEFHSNMGSMMNADDFTLSSARNGFDPNATQYGPMNDDFTIGSRSNVGTNDYTPNDARSFQESTIASTLASFFGPVGQTGFQQPQNPRDGQYYGGGYNMNRNDNFDPSITSYGMSNGAPSHDVSYVNSNSMTENEGRSVNDATLATGATGVTGETEVTEVTDYQSRKKDSRRSRSRSGRRRSSRSRRRDEMMDYDEPGSRVRGSRRSGSRNHAKLFGKLGSRSGSKLRNRSKPRAASFDESQLNRSRGGRSGSKSRRNEYRDDYDNSYEDETIDKTKISKRSNKTKSLYDQFMDGIFGPNSESASRSNEEDDDEDEDEDESSDESTDPGPPPQDVQLGAMSIAGRSQITNFTQDSYEQFEKPSFVPAAFGGNGFFRPSSRQRSIRALPTQDEYTTIGKVMSFGKGKRHGSRKQMQKRATRESRDDYF